MTALSKSEHVKTGSYLGHLLSQIQATLVLSGPILDIGGPDAGLQVRVYFALKIREGITVLQSLEFIKSWSFHTKEFHHQT